MAPAKQVPTNPPAARVFAKLAFSENRYKFDTGGHLQKRMQERRLNVADLKNAIAKMIRIEEYPGSQPWATCWRVTGPSLEGNRIGVGVRLYLDDDLEWAVCITIIDDVE